VEWEAAAGGVEGRRYPWGEGEERTWSNTIETRIKRTTPVGVFPEGNSPEQIADLAGNAYEWTTSLYGEIRDVDLDPADFPYPYDSADGREEIEAGLAVRRVVRGGGWYFLRLLGRAELRLNASPDSRFIARGLRVAVSSPSE
jgi:formylglycine-generating enzyme required for sulfatase activity